MNYNNSTHDKDGLTFTQKIHRQGRHLFLDRIEIFISPECGSIANYLFSDPALWSLARLRVDDFNIGRKGAPVIGVPFSKALQKSLESPKVQKSLFKNEEWTKYQGKAVIATMLAHTSATSNHIEFQAWQFLYISEETFYIHALINKSLCSAKHLDGATMLHTKPERMSIMSSAKKIKGASYTKHFRLDGEIPIDKVKDILDLYMPIQELSAEFLSSIDTQKTAT